MNTTTQHCDSLTYTHSESYSHLFQRGTCVSPNRSPHSLTHTHTLAPSHTRRDRGPICISIIHARVRAPRLGRRLSEHESVSCVDDRRAHASWRERGAHVRSTKWPRCDRVGDRYLALCVCTAFFFFLSRANARQFAASFGRPVTRMKPGTTAAGSCHRTVNGIRSISITLYFSLSHSRCNWITIYRHATNC